MLQRSIKCIIKFTAEHKTLLAALILSVAFIACLAYAQSLGSRIRYPDEKDYITIAKHLIDGKGYTLDGENPTAYRAPGFTLLVAAGLSTGGIAAARILNMICFVGCLLCVFIISRRIAGFTAGIFAMLSGILYPVMFYTAGTLYPQTFGALLLLCCVLIVFSAPLNAQRAGLCGLIGGILMLTIPSMVFFWGCLLLTALFLNERRSFHLVILAGICSVLLLGLWFTRNYKQFERPFFVSTNSGINLLLGNSENTTPNAGVNVDLSKYNTSGLNEIQRDSYYRTSAIKYIRNRPLRSIRMYGLKFINYFNYRNKLKMESESSRMRNSIMLISYGGLIILTIIRLILIKSIPLSRFEMFALGAYILNGAFAALFFTRIRFRLPFDWLLVCIAGITLAHITQPLLGSRDKADNN